MVMIMPYEGVSLHILNKNALDKHIYRQKSRRTVSHHVNFNKIFIVKNVVHVVAYRTIIMCSFL
jgi:hypothetical protein